MQISSLGVQLTNSPDAPTYTWVQTTRFFLLGLLYASVYALLPVAVVLWHNYQNYSDPIDWNLVWEMIAAAIGPVALSYWREHKALLKIPPWFDIPDDFKPQLKKVETTATVSVKETHVEQMEPKKTDAE